MNNKSETLRIRMTKAQRDAIDAAAGAVDLAPSTFARVVMLKFLRANGHLPERERKTVPEAARKSSAAA